MEDQSDNFQNGDNGEEDVIRLEVCWFACIDCGVSFVDFAHSADNL